MLTKKFVIILLIAVFFGQTMTSSVYAVEDSNVAVTDEMTPLEKKVLEIFENEDNKTLANQVTQEKINKLKDETKKSNESMKDHILSLLNQAEQQLQQFNLLGLGNNIFAQLYFHADGSYKAELVTRSGQPHSYFNNYATIKIKTSGKKVIYTKNYIGNEQQIAKRENIELKEGYFLEITKQEPNRFETNHNDELKQNNSNPFIYVVRNGRLERVDDKNRYIHFLGLGDVKYAALKVDYNSQKLVLNIKPVKPHVYFKGSYEKIEILNTKEEVVFCKDFIGTEQQLSENINIDFKAGYKIRLTGSEHHVRVKLYNEDQELVPLNLTQNKSTVILNENGVVVEFTANDSMIETYQAAFFERIPQEQLNELKQKSLKHQEFINWILQSPEVMQSYLSAGYASSSKQGDMCSYQYINNYSLSNELEALEIWYKIWEKYKDSHSGVNLNMAIAIALEFNKGMVAWYNSSLNIDPLVRYKNFYDAQKNNILFEDFSRYTAQEMRNVVNAKITDEDMAWLREYIKENKPEMITRNNITKGYSLIRYVSVNPDTGASVHGSQFYGPNPTIKEVIKYGGVCGAMSKLGSVVAQAYGVPAFPVGQPGHCAYIYLDSQHDYKLGYDVFGWNKCANANTTLPYIFINHYYSLNLERFKESEYERYKAKNTRDGNKKLMYINKSIEKEPLNYFAWQDKINLMAKTVSSKEFSQLLNDAEKAFESYPVIAVDISQKNARNNVYSLFSDNTYQKLNEEVTQQKIESAKKGVESLQKGPYLQELYELINKASNMVQQISLYGLGNNNFANLVHYADDSQRTVLMINSGQPHSYFKDTYATIVIKDQNSQEIYKKEFVGNKSNKQENVNVILKNGYRIEFILKEINRFKISDEKLNRQPINNTYTYVVKDNRLMNEDNSV